MELSLGNSLSAPDIASIWCDRDAFSQAKMPHLMLSVLLGVLMCLRPAVVVRTLSKHCCCLFSGKQRPGRP